MATTHIMWFSALVAMSVVAGKLHNLPRQRVCLEDSDCDVGECCGKITGPLIVSKRQISSIEGTCKAYLQQDEYCWGQWKQNGACGCAPTTFCKHFPPTKLQPLGHIGKRRPAPGKYLCKPRS